MRAVHPGEILREDVLKPLDMSARKFAELLDVPQNRVSAILNEQRAITPDTALRIARLLDMTPDYWLRLQMRYDLQTQQAAAGREITRTIRPLSKAEVAAITATLT
ncbi:MAG TPA: HigA family addiction module antitoxin [Verrucomicrobiae bacterium]|nr:HigA family addiction module antitoxin [Verrucomicrobiae bacterium]